MFEKIRHVISCDITCKTIILLHTYVLKSRIIMKKKKWISNTKMIIYSLISCFI